MSQFNSKYLDALDKMKNLPSASTVKNLTPQNYLRPGTTPAAVNTSRRPPVSTSPSTPPPQAPSVTLPKPPSANVPTPSSRVDDTPFGLPNIPPPVSINPPAPSLAPPISLAPPTFTGSVTGTTSTLPSFEPPPTLPLPEPAPYIPPPISLAPPVTLPPPISLAPPPILPSVPELPTLPVVPEIPTLPPIPDEFVKPDMRPPVPELPSIPDNPPPILHAWTVDTSMRPPVDGSHQNPMAPVSDEPSPDQTTGNADGLSGTPHDFEAPVFGGTVSGTSSAPPETDAPSTEESTSGGTVSGTDQNPPITVPDDGLPTLPPVTDTDTTQPPITVPDTGLPTLPDTAVDTSTRPPVDGSYQNPVSPVSDQPSPDQTTGDPNGLPGIPPDEAPIIIPDIPPPVFTGTSTGSDNGNPPPPEPAPPPPPPPPTGDPVADNAALARWEQQMQLAFGALGTQQQAAMANIGQQEALASRRAANINAAMGRGAGGGLAGLEAQTLLGGMQQRQQTLADFAGREAGLRDTYAERIRQSMEGEKGRGLQLALQERSNQFREKMTKLEFDLRAAEAAGDHERQREIQQMMIDAAKEMSFIEGVLGMDPDTAKYFDDAFLGGIDPRNSSGGTTGGTSGNTSQSNGTPSAGERAAVEAERARGYNVVWSPELGKFVSRRGRTPSGAPYFVYNSATGLWEPLN